MGQAPWQGDACSLVEAFRRGERSPLRGARGDVRGDRGERAERVVPPRPGTGRGRRRRRRRVAAVRRGPDRGQGTRRRRGLAGDRGLRGLPRPRGRPHVGDGRAPHHPRRAPSSAGQTTASEFGGVNVTRTELHGTTRNPWSPTAPRAGRRAAARRRSPAATSPSRPAATAAARSASRPASAGSSGLKATYGRIPKAPQQQIGNYTTTIGCMARSVRDTARWFDVCNGHDPRDPFSLPRVEGWEAGLGTHLADLRRPAGARSPRPGATPPSPRSCGSCSRPPAPTLCQDAGLLPGRRSRHQAAEHGRRLVDQRDDRRSGPNSATDTRRVRGELTPEIRYGLASTAGLYCAEARARIERRRMEVNETMARIFDPIDGVDFVITASNPDVAFAADGPAARHLRRRAGRRRQQRAAHLPGQPPRQPGHLDPCRHARRPADRTADRRPPLQRAAAARSGTARRAPSPLAARGSQLRRCEPTRRSSAAGLFLAVTIAAFESTAVITALPTIVDDLGGRSLYGATLAANFLANLVAIVAAGEAADRRGPAGAVRRLRAAVRRRAGRRRARRPTSSSSSSGRALQGGGIGGFGALAYVGVRRGFPEEHQPRMYAVLSAGWVLPTLIAPFLAGAIVDRWPVGDGSSSAWCPSAAIVSDARPSANCGAAAGRGDGPTTDVVGGELRPGGAQADDRRRPGARRAAVRAGCTSPGRSWSPDSWSPCRRSAACCPPGGTGRPRACPRSSPSGCCVTFAFNGSTPSCPSPPTASITSRRRSREPRSWARRSRGRSARSSPPGSTAGSAPRRLMASDRRSSGSVPPSSCRSCRPDTPLLVTFAVLVGRRARHGPAVQRHDDVRHVDHRRAPPAGSAARSAWPTRSATRRSAASAARSSPSSERGGVALTTAAPGRPFALSAAAALVAVAASRRAELTAVVTRRCRPASPCAGGAARRPRTPRSGTARSALTVHASTSSA